MLANLKELRELMAKAKSDYENTTPEEQKYHYIFYIVMGVYIVAALSVFIMPENILEKHESLLKFTEFMVRYFPNISVLTK